MCERRCAGLAIGVAGQHHAPPLRCPVGDHDDETQLMFDQAEGGVLAVGEISLGNETGTRWRERSITGSRPAAKLVGSGRNYRRGKTRPPAWMLAGPDMNALGR
ncbi:hypothetical protein AYO39_01610 [Actinobacteria bacterium SCGC AG-212-D09]|nr:hypothetical protein AYO39_01610 [Actinobacteria bacterium SCGC AG-212-D09]